jgi:hypothetical protein
MRRDDPNASAEEMAIVVGVGIVLFEIQKPATVQREDETSDEIRLGFIPLTAIEVWVDKADERCIWRYAHVEMLSPRQISRPIYMRLSRFIPLSPLVLWGTEVYSTFTIVLDALDSAGTSR